MEDPEVSLRQNLTCSLCLDILTSPVILKNCAHSFCKNCMKSLMRSMGHQRTYICPQCRRSFKHSDVMSNHQLNSTVDSYRTVLRKRETASESVPTRDEFQKLSLQLNKIVALLTRPEIPRTTRQVQNRQELEQEADFEAETLLQFKQRSLLTCRKHLILIVFIICACMVFLFVCLAMS